MSRSFCGWQRLEMFAFQEISKDFGYIPWCPCYGDKLYLTYIQKRMVPLQVSSGACHRMSPGESQVSGCASRQIRRIYRWSDHQNC